MVFISKLPIPVINWPKIHTHSFIEDTLLLKTKSCVPFSSTAINSLSHWLVSRTRQQIAFLNRRKNIKITLMYVTSVVCAVLCVNTSFTKGSERDRERRIFTDEEGRAEV